MSDDQLTEEDIVTWDDFPEAVSDALEDADVDVGVDPEPEDAPWLEPDEAVEIYDRKMTEFMHHLVHEDCDTPECKEYRDAFGLTPGAGSPEGGAEADADAEGDETDEQEDESGEEADAGNESPDDSDSSDSKESTESQETDESDSTDDEPETNYLGEEI